MQKNIVKQDVNFLDKPIWFLNSRHDGLGFVWNDIDGYIYRSGYKLPGKIDIVILLYLLLRSQNNNYNTTVETSKREILKNCNLPVTDREYYKRIEDSLKRWTSVNLTFSGIFYDKKDYLSMGFGIIDSFKIQKNKKILVDFNIDWLTKIKDSAYFKYLNFEVYKRLKRGISRRLYELLIKNFKGRNECFYKLTNLAIKLTLSGRKKKTGEKIIYASDVLVAIKPAINEINKLALTPNITKITGLAIEDVFIIKYKITGKAQDRIIYFYKEIINNAAKKTKVKKENTLEFLSERVNVASQAKSTNKIYSEALQWLNTIPYFNENRKKEITNMEVVDIEQIYKGIREEYERLTKQNKKPKAGWVYKAFIDKWQFSGQLEPKKKQLIEAEIKRKIDNKRQEVEKYINNNGGINNILYNGKRVEIMQNYGLYIVKENVLEIWNDVNVKLLK